MVNGKDEQQVQAHGAPSPLERLRVPGLDAILGQPFRILEDGFVRVVDYMGDDSAIVQAARVSYGAGTKRVQEDRGLIRYLMRHSHTTPFEMCEIKFHVRVPMDTWRQWIRHRTASVNEYSTRYSVAIDATHQTSPKGWRAQSAIRRQGSSEYLPFDVGQGLSNGERELHQRAREVYEARIAAGVAREQARKDLPLSTYTEAYWKIDLHNLLGFLAQRMTAQAQDEIRAYATVMGQEIVSRWVPLAWQAFLDFRLHAVQFSRVEYEIMSALSAGDSGRARDVAEAEGLLKRDTEGALVPSRERAELEGKVRAMGLTPPWT